MSDLGQQPIPYTAFSQTKSLQGDNIPVFAGFVLACYTYSQLIWITLVSPLQSENVVFANLLLFFKCLR